MLLIASTTASGTGEPEAREGLLIRLHTGLTGVPISNALFKIQFEAKSIPQIIEIILIFLNPFISVAALVLAIYLYRKFTVLHQTIAIVDQTDRS